MTHPRNDRKQQQTMKPKPQEIEKDFEKDLRTFERLPAKTIFHRVASLSIGMVNNISRS